MDDGRGRRHCYSAAESTADESQVDKRAGTQWKACRAVLVRLAYQSGSATNRAAKGLDRC